MCLSTNWSRYSMASPIFKQYIELKEQIEALEAQKDELMYQVMNEIEEDGQTQKITPYGKFVIVPRRTYIYSDRVKKIQEELYVAKKTEENEGIAELKSATQHIRVEKVKL